MNYLFDIILVAVFGLTILICCLRGFMRSVIEVAKLIVSYLLARIFGGYVTNWLREHIVLDGLKDRIAQIIKDLIAKYGPAGAATGEEATKFDLSSLFTEMPEEFTELIDKSGVSLDSLSDKFAPLKEATGAQLGELSANIAKPLVNTISAVAGFVIVFTVSMIVLSIVGFFICKIVDLPVIKDIDRALGAALGAVAGVVYVWIICLVVGAIVERNLLGDSTPALEQFASNSFILKFVCSHSSFDFINLGK